MAPDVVKRFDFRPAMARSPDVSLLRAEHDFTAIPRRLNLGWLLLVAVSFAFVGGAGQLLALGYLKYGQHRALLLGPHMLWMTPLANLLLVVAIALLVAVLARIAPGLVGPRLAVFLLASASVLGVPIAIPGLHRLASLVLALGIATEVTRTAIGRPRSFDRFLARSAVALGSLFVVLGVGVAGWRTLTERRAMAALPATPAKAPNVLLLIWDTARAASLSAYGYGRPTTPNLERLAKQGVIFDWAISTAPWTLPSHASMFTGRLPHDIAAGFRMPLDDRDPTLAEVMREKGYITAGFVANTRYVGYEFGLGRGFVHYEDYPISWQELVLASSIGRAMVRSTTVRKIVGHYDIFGRKPASRVNADVVRWLSAHQGRPFFAFANYFDAHEPYLPPAPYREQFGPQGSRRLDRIDHHGFRNGNIRWRNELGPEERQAEHDAYDGALAYLDEQLDELMHALEARGLLRNTIIILSADHGEQFGEHGLFLHANSVYTQLVRVPLIIWGTGRVPVHTTVTRPVSLRDLPATVIDLAGLGSDMRFPGRSLARHWTTYLSELATPDTVLAELEQRGDLRSLLVDQHHYIRKGNGERELYDLRVDPFETNNLAGTMAGLETIKLIGSEYTDLLARGWYHGKYQQPSRKNSAPEADP